MTTKTTSTNETTSGKTHKKQVRRRLHTSRPYQERLLNMAEARREIVTALKQHRASMKQASKIPPPPEKNLFSPPLPPPPLPDPFCLTSPPSLNLLLPNQPLGLNLNFQDFIQTNVFECPKQSSTSSMLWTDPGSSSSSSSSSHPNIYSSPSPPLNFTTTTSESDNNNTVMKVVEPEIKEPVIVEDDVFPKINDVMEFPSWLNQTDEELFHPYYNLTDHYSQNPSLSCMEIGEIESIDGDDWFA